MYTYFDYNYYVRTFEEVAWGNRIVKVMAKVKEWVAAINDAGVRALEGWCHSRFCSYANGPQKIRVKLSSL